MITQYPTLRGKRLLIVVNVPWFFVMHRISIARWARDLGMQVSIACGDGDGAEDIVREGFDFHHLPFDRRPHALIKDARSRKHFSNLYRTIKPDLVHHVTLKPIVYGTHAAYQTQVPAVINAFSGLGLTFVDESLLGRARRQLLIAALRSTQRFTNQRTLFENKDDAQLLIREGAVRPETAIVIPGVGVDTQEFKPTAEPDGVPVVLCASRMLRSKGIAYFVEAAKRVHQQGVAAKFVLVGEPDISNPDSLQRDQLMAWQAAGHIEWLGFQRDMPTLIARSHIVCLPSYYREGVPRILLEGAACGRALVSTDMPGCRDICDVSTGISVPPHNVDRLTEALVALLTDAPRRAQLGRQARQRVEASFSLDRVLSQMHDLYGSLIAGMRP